MPLAALPDALRWQVVLVGLLFAIAALGCLLLRGRHALVALVALTIVAAVCIVMWRNAQA